ncbi:MAG: hypothetical protein FJ265_07495 [Planctomycetes bacterium]|nr:hypothetical protein [Planctomycetota bacterium]
MLTSPRRIAVVILAALIGWCLQYFAGFQQALVLGLLAGLVVAGLVPANAACPVPRRGPPQ